MDHNKPTLHAGNASGGVDVALVRAQAFEEAARIAEKDNRSDLAKDVGFIPEWQKACIRVAREIRALVKTSAPLRQEDAGAIARARAALAELASMSEEDALLLRHYAQDLCDEFLNLVNPPTDRAGAAVGGREEASQIEREAERIYNTWKDQEGWVPWVTLGNSYKQRNARQQARLALASSHPLDGSVKGQDEGGGL